MDSDDLAGLDVIAHLHGMQAVLADEERGPLVREHADGQDGRSTADQLSLMGVNLLHFALDSSHLNCLPQH